ncbi:ribosome recycling factor [Candidatus Woesebacteria bacterium GWB1_43_5]|uniref:Ribosome recycling factor n=1 Tax=Candidatus Woesebacteria bacterium GWB1_43_5 TaxID=1802474 RepID=A0A1F7WS98_9BACT|nr:MAG: ribosome recycling factor [Candidatus Woesebacteria bacterium GWB1_43_5]
MDESEVLRKMQGVLNLVVSDIGTIRTGRATGGLVEDISVLAYGGQQKLTIKELSTISASDPQTIVIDPWDKSIIGEIRQGLLAANVGLNPSIDGEVIRISFPPLTSEDREKYVKLLSVKLEVGKVMIRQIRTEFMKKIREFFEKKEISEDEKFRQEKRLQEITDEFVDKIDEAGEKKEKEILNI